MKCCCKHRFRFDIYELGDYVKSVNIDYVSKTINLELYQMVLEDNHFTIPSFVLFSELEKMKMCKSGINRMKSFGDYNSSEMATDNLGANNANFSVYDEFGGMIYSVVFEDLSVERSNVSYSYGDSGEAVDFFKLKFESFVFIPNEKKVVQKCAAGLQIEMND